MAINPRGFLNYLLFCSNCKFGIGNNHYVQGWNVGIFTNLTCVEKSLTNATNTCKNMFCCDNSRQIPEFPINNCSIPKNNIKSLN